MMPMIADAADLVSRFSDLKGNGLATNRPPRSAPVQAMTDWAHQAKQVCRLTVTLPSCRHPREKPALAKAGARTQPGFPLSAEIRQGSLSKRRDDAIIPVRVLKSCAPPPCTAIWAGGGTPMRSLITWLHTRQNGTPRLRILQSYWGRKAPQW